MYMLLECELKQSEMKLQMQVEPGPRRKLGVPSRGQWGTQEEPSARTMAYEDTKKDGGGVRWEIRTLELSSLGLSGAESCLHR